MKKFKLDFNLIRTMIAIGIALLLALVIILLTSDDPWTAFYYFIAGPLSKAKRFANVIEAMLPLVFTGLSVSIIARTGVFNLASEGSLFIGGAVAALCGVLLPLPPVVSPVVILLIGGLAGMLALLIPTYLRVKWNANEIVSSLMLNYVLYYLGTFLIRTFVRDPDSGYLQSTKFHAEADLPVIVPGTRIHAGAIIALLCVAALYFFLFRSRLGYKVRMVGENPKFSFYSGIPYALSIFAAQALAGFVCGLGGATEMLGMFDCYKWTGLPGYGWDGIIVATLARNNPAWVPLGAFFLAYMRTGADMMTRYTDVQNEVVSIIQGVVIILLVAESFLAGWQKRRTFKEATENAKLEGGAEA
ncbi:MAG: ABC transporter permease [Oscillospiraceae bacterium]|jgi:ABC-type uncharacterized transport system permease subunit|nr:ABC transporter permease [Oscillospiraceae bacterium]MDY4191255.1 ABC transporter permease [Oscillospiraceae bacterium]